MPPKSKRKNLTRLLEGTDRRSIGRVSEVVAAVLSDPGRFPEVFQGMLSADPIIRMRCADAVEKISAARPGQLQRYKSTLINRVAKIDQQEVQWHVAQLFSRLTLTSEERRCVVRILYGYLKSKSSIVRTFSMQALADLAGQDIALRPEIFRSLEKLTESGTPAMRSRGRKLLANLGAVK